ncbi:hypothetical protein EBB07_05480 [Paenibacillaceae bacterium]|nr:hypothetical protein EBB07_05480 [Paenibacillaceae bacterium]
MKIRSKNMLVLCSALAFVLLFMSTEGGKAASIDSLDQFTPSNPSSHGGSNNVGQSFTAGLTGYMYDLELIMLNESAPRMTVTVEILEGQNMNGTVLGRVSFDSSHVTARLPGDWVHVHFIDGVYLEAGNVYTIKMTTSPTSGQLQWSMFANNVYDRGTSYYLNSWGSHHGDFGFRTYVAAEQRVTTNLSVSGVSGNYGDTVQLAAGLTAAGTGLPSQTISFAINGVAVGTEQTDASGRATLNYPLDLIPDNYTITASFAGYQTYKVSNGSGLLSVNKRPLSVTINDAYRLYGASNPLFTGTLTGMREQDGITATYGTTADSSSDTGMYPIKATLNDPNGKLNNYEVTLTPGTLTIEQAPLSVTPDALARWLNYDNPVLTGELIGAVPSDNLSVSYRTTADKSSPVGTYKIEAELIDPEDRLGNYEVTMTSAELVVYAAPHPAYSSGDTEKGVTGDIGLATADERERPITWSSSDTRLLDPATGQVQRPTFLEGNAEITLRASVEAYGTVYETVYDVTILAADMTDETAVTIDSQNVEIGYAQGDNATQVRNSISLKTRGTNGTTISWTSSAPSLIDTATGAVRRPSYFAGDQSVTLEATVSKGDASLKVTFQLTVIRSNYTGIGNVFEPQPKPEPEAETPMPELYFDIETPHGKERAELTQNEGVLDEIWMTVDEVDAKFTLENGVLEKLKSLHPDMTLFIITRINTITIHLSKMEIDQADGALRISVRQVNERPELASAITEQQAKVLVGAMQFDIAVLDANGQRVKTDRPFSRFVEQRIRLGNTTVFDNASVVRWDEERREPRHVPASFSTQNGEVVAVVRNGGTGIYLVTERTVGFADMQNHWGREDVEKLASKLIVQGRGTDRFEPNGELTRAETTALLNRALGIFYSGSASHFSDVRGQWYVADVVTAYQNGLITGYNDGTFRPNESITREELAVMIARALSFVGDAPLIQPTRDWQPVDVDDISPWAREAVNQAIRLNILHGDEKGLVRPQAATTRAEMAVMLSRMLQTLNWI